MSQFGEQNQTGQVTEYDAAIDDNVAQAVTEGHYASLAELVDVYGNPEVPADVLTEHPGKFYTALPLDAFSKAAAPEVRTQTYNIPSPSFVPVQVLRKNRGRRDAKVRITTTSDTNGMVFWANSAQALQGLASVIPALGVYANTPVGSLQGPWGMHEFPFGPAAFDWNGQPDLWVCSPFVSSATGPSVSSLVVSSISISSLPISGAWSTGPLAVPTGASQFMADVNVLPNTATGGYTVLTASNDNVNWFNLTSASFASNGNQHALLTAPAFGWRFVNVYVNNGAVAATTGGNVQLSFGSNATVQSPNSIGPAVYCSVTEYFDG